VFSAGDVGAMLQAHDHCIRLSTRGEGILGHVIAVSRTIEDLLDLVELVEW